MPVTEQTPQSTETPPAGQAQLPLDASAAPADPSNPTPTPPVAPPQRPEGLPDAYWDAERGIRADLVAADLAKFHADQAKAAESFKDFPEDAAKAGDFYKLPEAMLPEGVTLPEGVKFEANKPLLDAALPILHKHKVPLDAFHDLARAFNAYELSNYQTVMKDVAEDGKKLGANAPARRKAVGDGLAALLGPDDAKFFDANALTAQAVEVFERLLEKVRTQSNIVPFDQRRNEAPQEPPQTVEQRWYGPTAQKAS